MDAYNIDVSNFDPSNAAGEDDGDFTESEKKLLQELDLDPKLVTQSQPVTSRLRP